MNITLVIMHKPKNREVFAQDNGNLFVEVQFKPLKVIVTFSGENNKIVETVKEAMQKLIEALESVEFVYCGMPRGAEISKIKAASIAKMRVYLIDRLTKSGRKGNFTIGNNRACYEIGEKTFVVCMTLKS